MAGVAGFARRLVAGIERAVQQRLRGAGPCFIDLDDTVRLRPYVDPYQGRPPREPKFKMPGEAP